MNQEIPKKTVYRLSLYNRCLERLGDEVVDTVSSDILAKVAGVKPTQLRKDLAFCGHIGKRGRGYDIARLKNYLKLTLRGSQLQPVVLIGAGNLGSALLRYDGFAREGFEIAGAFDLTPSRQEKAGNLPIRPMGQLRSFIDRRKIKMAILCVPGQVAQEVANQIIGYGIQAILNFAPTLLQVPPHVTINNVNLAMELESLRYFVR